MPAKKRQWEEVSEEDEIMSGSDDDSGDDEPPASRPSKKGSIAGAAAGKGPGSSKGALAGFAKKPANKAVFDSEGDEDEDEDDGPRGSDSDGSEQALSASDMEDDDENDEDEDEDNDEGGSDEEGEAGPSGRKGSRDAGALEEELADIPFEVLEQVRQDGHGVSGKAARIAARQASEQQKSFKRLNRHRPSEMSSKRPVSRFREVVQAPNRKPRDPRFDPTGARDGDDEKFRQRYSFVFDEMLPQEKETIRKQMQRESNPAKKQALQRQLNRVDQQLRQEQLKRSEDKIKMEWKAKEKASVAAGKKPYYLKPTELKRLALLERYKALQKDGRLDKYMEKRRRRNAAKDHRYIPAKRREAAGGAE